eukprot:CAMPEP_0198224820 /NCGR_PEP_ID=MMETSP1445-20131203/98429_1 /TAXON_ID=36898 /ORGANISM="Pyramimonas sp., Strain CCMP2087" /LENGTH=46 /DNA_ID= /DNA_START= /DNA_END= /DNA_ORIENTATION=
MWLPRGGAGNPQLNQALSEVEHNSRNTPKMVYGQDQSFTGRAVVAF